MGFGTGKGRSTCVSSQITLIFTRSAAVVGQRQIVTALNATSLHCHRAWHAINFGRICACPRATVEVARATAVLVHNRTIRQNLFAGFH